MREDVRFALFVCLGGLLGWCLARLERAWDRYRRAMQSREDVALANLIGGSAERIREGSHSWTLELGPDVGQEASGDAFMQRPFDAREVCVQGLGSAARVTVDVAGQLDSFLTERECHGELPRGFVANVGQRVAVKVQRVVAAPAPETVRVRLLGLGPAPFDGDDQKTGAP